MVKVFEELGYPVPDDEELQRFIGPAIVESLQRNNIPDDLLDEGIAIYRRYYAQEAVFDDPNNPGQKGPGRLNNTINDGIPEQLSKLRADGYYLAIASCKPQYQCIPICEHFHLAAIVNGIYGASEDNSRLDKDQVILWALDHIGLDEAAGDKALMVGARWTDADGAKACGLDCLGCGWGYAEPGELKVHGAYKVIDSVSELAQTIEDYFV